MIDLSGKTVLLTQPREFMGPSAASFFAELGAKVHETGSSLTNREQCANAWSDADAPDILLVNLCADTSLGTPTVELSDNAWIQCFDRLVHPLHWLVQAALVDMLKRKSGKIVVFGSATGVRARALMPAYCAARSAQVGYVRSVGAEVASRNVQINLIAQNFVENPMYFPPERIETESFRAFLAEHVPVGRLARAEEDVALAAFLASSHADFIAGQAIPFAGGWVQ